MLRWYKDVPGHLDTLLVNLESASIRSAVDRFCLDQRRPLLLLVLVSLLLYMPGIVSMPPTDRDEARYTQATKQMVETGDYIRIYFQEKFRNKKPAGIYWLQAGAVNLLGGNAVKDEIWPYRIPSLFCAIGTVLLMFLMARRVLGGNGPGMMAGLLMAVTPLLLAVARVGTTDSTLLFVTLAAQYNLMQLYLDLQAGQKPKLRNALLFWIAAGAGTLIKGPLTLAVGLTTTFSLMVLHRNVKLLKALRPWFGIPILLAMVAPWLTSIQIATEGAFLRDSLFGDFGKKLVSGQESHGAPPGLYILLMGLTSWPCSLMVIPAIYGAWQERKTVPFSAFSFCWIVPFLVILELVPTKLPHYVLPLYPAVVLLTVRMAWNDAEFEPGPRVLFWIHRLYRFLWKLFLPIMVAVTLLTAMANRYPLVSVLAALAMALGAIAVSRLRLRSSLGALMAGAIVMLVGIPVLCGGIAPRLDPLWISRDVSEKVTEIRETDPELRLYSVDFKEPSLVFMTGTDTSLCRLENIETDYNIHMAALLSDSDAEKLAVPLVKVMPIDGINYSKGQFISQGLYLHPESDYGKR
jgi:4-amino-4-deoxy-L-arabinose transferase-like glycosyltransferase